MKKHLPNPRKRTLGRNKYEPATREWIFSNCRVDGECWTWLGALSSLGYARISSGGECFMVHRRMYELDRGEIPSGLVLDHLCRNRACCNPAHLEPVTQRENVRRGLMQKSKGDVCYRCGAQDFKVRGRSRHCLECERIRNKSADRKAALQRNQVARRERNRAAFSWGYPLTRERVAAIKADVATGMRGCDVARAHGVWESTVSEIRHGRRFADVAAKSEAA